jgi:hypothetical protein
MNGNSIARYKKMEDAVTAAVLACSGTAHPRQSRAECSVANRDLCEKRNVCAEYPWSELLRNNPEVWRWQKDDPG